MSSQTQSPKAGNHTPNQMCERIPTLSIFLLGVLALAFAFLGGKAEARWYSPETAWFISRAPYPPAVEHPYSFGNARPSILVDVTGALPQSAGAAKIGPGRRLGTGAVLASLSIWAYNLWGCPATYGGALSNALKSRIGPGKGQMSDDYVHCVISCVIAQECGQSAALNAGWMQEAGHWFNDPNEEDTNDDLTANATGRRIADQIGDGACAFGPDCETGCEKAGY